MVVSDQQVGHREQGRVHHPGRPREEQDAPLGLGQGHEDHSDAVDQLAADVDWPGSRKTRVRKEFSG